MPSSPRVADLAAVATVLVYPALLTRVYFVLLADAPAGVQQGVYAVGKTLQFAFPLVWVLAVQRRRPKLGPPRAAGLAAGLLFGAAVFAAMLVLYHAWLKPAGFFDATAVEVRRKIAGFGITSAAGFIAVGAFYALVHSFLEEYYWRWFAFGQLAKWMSWKAAAAISSLAFAAHHVLLLAVYFGAGSPATWLFSLAVAVGGAFWAWLYHKSNSLYGPWWSHLLVDAAIFAIGYDLAGPFNG